MSTDQTTRPFRELRDGMSPESQAKAAEKAAALDQQITEMLQAPIHLIAMILDHPNVYMGGPSRQSVRKAERILETLKAEGYVKDV